MAYLTTKTFTKGKDWDALWKYIEESGNLDLLQRRLSSRAVQEYMDANEGELPPGFARMVGRINATAESLLAGRPKQLGWADEFLGTDEEVDRAASLLLAAWEAERAL